MDFLTFFKIQFILIIKSEINKLINMA